MLLALLLGMLPLSVLHCWGACWVDIWLASLLAGCLYVCAGVGPRNMIVVPRNMIAVPRNMIAVPQKRLLFLTIRLRCNETWDVYSLSCQIIPEHNSTQWQLIAKTHISICKSSNASTSSAQHGILLCSLTQAYTCTTHIRMNSYDATRISQTRVGSSDIYVHAPSILYNTTLCIFKDLNSETHKNTFFLCVFLIFLGNFETEYENSLSDTRQQTIPLFEVHRKAVDNVWKASHRNMLRVK